MTDKVYLSGISPPWTFERQEKLLGDLMKVPGVYRDDVKAMSRKMKRVDDLKDRTALLTVRGRTSGMTLHVASLACLAYTVADFTDVLAKLAERGAALDSKADNLVIPPNPPAALMAQAIQAFAASKRGDGLPKGREIVREANLADTRRRVEIIRPFWHLPEPSTVELLKMAGKSKKHPMAPATAKDHLGSRVEAQGKYAREQARLAAMTKSRVQRKGKRSAEFMLGFASAVAFVAKDAGSPAMAAALMATNGFTIDHLMEADVPPTDLGVIIEVMAAHAAEEKADE